jgi:replicative DNA helicase
MVTNKCNIQSFEKIPPQDIEIEKAVLGALILESGAIHKVIGVIDSVSFYKPEHQRIFEIIKSLSQHGCVVDLLTVTKLLRDKNDLDNIGGPIYITQLTSMVASAAHIEYHARIIAQLYLQRELIRIGLEIASDAYDQSADIEDLLNTFKLKLSGIDNYAASSNTGQSHTNAMLETILNIEAGCTLAKEGKSPGIPTGIKTLDRATGGWRNANLIILASRPSVGKTSLALFFTKIAAKAGRWVNFFGLEMKSSDLLRIMISGETGISRTNLRDGLLTDDDWDRINDSTSRLKKLPIIWNDFAGITSSQIKSIVIRNRQEGRCDLVVIDYMQLVKPMDKKAPREQQVAEICRTLKEIALNENIPVICLLQLNMKEAIEMPQLHHLGESGAIEEDSDVVILPWKRDGKFNLTIAKNRRGKFGTFEIYASEELTDFGDKSDCNNFNPDGDIGPFERFRF